VVVVVLAVDANVVVLVVVTDALVVVCDFLTEVVAVDRLPVTHTDINFVHQNLALVLLSPCDCM